VVLPPALQAQSSRPHPLTVSCPLSPPAARVPQDCRPPRWLLPPRRAWRRLAGPWWCTRTSPCWCRGRAGRARRRPPRSSLGTAAAAAHGQYSPATGPRPSCSGAALSGLVLYHPLLCSHPLSLLRYITHVAGTGKAATTSGIVSSAAAGAGGGGGGVVRQSTVAQQVLESNPVLEVLWVCAIAPRRCVLPPS
jgi:hypothetical protein